MKYIKDVNETMRLKVEHKQDDDRMWPTFVLCALILFIGWVILGE